MRLYFVAAEPSGDVLAAEVMREILLINNDVEFLGVGGSHMRALGIESLFDPEELAVFGLLEGIKAFKTVKARVEDTALDIVKNKPDAIILVDSWGFMWRVAQRVKELGYDGARIKLIGPQVWATRPGRAKTLASNVDHLLCIHDFEVPFYQPFGLDTTVIGNPALERDQNGSGEAFRVAKNISEDSQVILLLLGSRKSEIVTVAPILQKTADEVCKGNANRVVVCVVADSVREKVEAWSKDWNFPFIISSDREEKTDAFASANVALACSGTVTTEVALQGVPLVIGYKIGWVTWLIARLFLMKSKFITLLNVAADREVAPEFIQTRFNVRNLKNAVEGLLNNPKLRQEQVLAQNQALEKMGRGGEGASKISAKKILELAK